MESIMGSSHSSMTNKLSVPKAENTKKERVVSVGGERQKLELITPSREENEEELRERRNEENLRKAEEHRREFEEKLSRGEITPENFRKAYGAIAQVVF